MLEEKMSYNIKRVAENITLSSCAPHLLANETKDGVKVVLVEYKGIKMKSSLEKTFDMYASGGSQLNRGSSHT